MIDLATTTRRTLRVDECQELFGVSRRTIYHWISNGHLDGAHLNGWMQISVVSVRERMALVTPPSVAARVQALHSQQA